jgi:hypothetical protein
LVALAAGQARWEEHEEAVVVQECLLAGVVVVATEAANRMESCCRVQVQALPPKVQGQEELIAQAHPELPLDLSLVLGLHLPLVQGLGLEPPL